jgi:transposase
MIVKRKQYTAQEKTKIVMEMLRGELTQQQLTSKYGVHSTQLHNWRKQAMEGIKSCFNGKNTTKKPEQSELLNELYQQIGQQKMELDWLKKKSELFS